MCAVAFDLFRSVIRTIWRLSTPMEVQVKGNGFLFTFCNERDMNRVKKGEPWGYQKAMILINDYDEFSDIMVVPLDFVWIWVEIEGLIGALTTMPTTRLIEETIGEVLQVENVGFSKGVVRVRLTLPLNNVIFL